MPKVLIVDDNIYILELLETLLSKHGFEVEKVLHAKETFRTVRLSAPDLILLDIGLAGYDGIQICKELKSNDSKFRDIPVILLSSLADLEKRYLESEANDFIQKPFNTKDLIAKIKRYTNSPIENLSP
jgi:DNA-binding response OmpR family regulator